MRAQWEIAVCKSNGAVFHSPHVTLFGGYCFSDSITKLKHNDEGRVVDDLGGLGRVLTKDAQMKDEGKAEQDTESAHQVPCLAAAILAHPPVQIFVALDANKGSRNTVGHLADQHQNAGSFAFESIDFVHKNQ